MKLDTIPRSYAKIISSVFFVLLLIFIIVTILNIKILIDPSGTLKGGGFTAASISFTLLAADIILPVPSSILMIANGALFGLAYGSLLSLAGGLTSSMLGYLIGRRSSKLINKIAGKEEQMQAERLIKKYGSLAVIITRPVPLLSETVSIFAGISGLSTNKMILTSIAGLLPGCLFYAATGVYATDFGSGAVSFLIVLFIAFLFWVINRGIKNKLTS